MGDTTTTSEPETTTTEATTTTTEPEPTTTEPTAPVTKTEEVSVTDQIEIEIPQGATYTISDDSIIGIDANGNFYAKSAGKATITLTLPNGEVQIIEVYVKAADLKGDVNLDGKVDAIDAQCVLEYAAAKGAGENPPIFNAEDTANEETALRNADVDGNGTIDAIDASNILIYAAIEGAEGTADWNDVLDTKSEPTD